MRNRNEFHGIATYEIIPDNNMNGQLNWIIKNPEMTVGNTSQIEDGDYLQIFDNMGNIKLQKTIYRDTDSYYNPNLNKQLYNGINIAWAAKGIAMDFWFNVFNSNFRAAIIKSNHLKNNS